MTVHTFYINALPQSGKTTIALGALERLQRQEVPVVYIAPMEDFAREMRRRTSVPCCGFQRAVLPGGLKESLGARAIVIDDCDWLVRHYGNDAVAEGIVKIMEYLGSPAGPTQLILVNWSMQWTKKST